jgi:hypothetical protein
MQQCLSKLQQRQSVGRAAGPDTRTVHTQMFDYSHLAQTFWYYSHLATARVCLQLQHDSLEMWPPLQVKPYNARRPSIQQLLTEPVHLMWVVRVARHTMKRQL